MINFVALALFDLLPEPWYSPYTSTGLILAGVLVAAVIAATVFIIFKFFGKKKK